MRGLLTAEPLHHYPMDRFSIKSLILYRDEHRVVHIGGGPTRNHPKELNFNILPMRNVDVVAAAEHLPLADQSVDVVVSNAVLEHVECLDVTVREMHRVLKPGGYVYIEIPFVQHYHSHDAHGVRFEDYRRLTKIGLTRAFDFCTPLDVGVCVGPTSTVCQILYSFLNDLSARRRYRQILKWLYYTIGNLIVWIDAFLPEETIRNSAIPSGIYFFGRKPDDKSEQLAKLPQPNSAFPRDVASGMQLVRRSPQRIDVRLTNTSRTTWLKSSPLPWGRVVLLARAGDSNGHREDCRVPLPRDVAPGESCEVSVDVPPQWKRLNLVLEIEGLCNFEQRGMRPLVVRLYESRTGATVARRWLHSVGH